MALLDYFQHMGQLALEGDAQGIIFWGAIYALVLLTYSLIFQIRVFAWPSTRGTLADSGLDRFGTRSSGDVQKYVVKAHYHYRVDGSEFEGKRVSPWIFVTSGGARGILQQQMKGVKRNADGTVEVIYNPRNPNKSYLIRPGRIGQAITAVLALAPILFYLYRYHS